MFKLCRVANQKMKIAGIEEETARPNTPMHNSI